MVNSNCLRLQTAVFFEGCTSPCPLLHSDSSSLWNAGHILVVAKYSWPCMHSQMQLQSQKLTKHLTVVYQGTRGTSTFSVDFHISANLEKYICRLWKMFHCFYFHTVFPASSHMSGLPEASQLVEWGFRLTVPSTCILHNDVATDLEVAQHSRADLQK